MKTAATKMYRAWQLTLLPLFVAPFLHAQTAASDNATCPMNDSVVIDVRVNDSWGPTYNTIPYNYLNGPAQHGTITILNADSIRYVPNANYSGPDSFLYGIEDPNNPGYAIDTARVFVNVQSSCWNLISYNQSTFACGDSVLFVGSASANTTSWTWDMGDGNIYSGPSLATVLHIYTTGTYAVTLTTVDNTSCTAVSTVTFTVTSGVSVNAGSDTTFCMQQGQLHATPSVPGNYLFSWSPSTGLSDSTAQDPFVEHVHNQQYVVTMVDTVSGCSATDTVIVSAYEWISGPVYTCLPDSVLLDLGPGASYYTWQFYIDTAGNNSTLNQWTQTYWATQQGYYVAIASFPGCGVLTTYLQVLDTCGTYAWVNNVWPGDCNYDLTADASDALHIGLAYGATGAVRPSATNSWTAQPMSDWSQNFLNCNYKHADADGNGTIDVNDTLPISLNYGLTHPYRLGHPQQAPASSPELYLVANYDTVGLQTLVTVDIRLGTSALPVDSIYGISFRITTDFPLVDTNLTDVNLGNTWLGTPGTDMFHFRKEFPGAGVMDVAECGTDHQNRLNGNGSIGSFLIVTTDNLSGIAICHFTLSDVTAVTVSQQYLALNTVSDSVVIDSSVPAGVAPTDQPVVFSVYPNPANGQALIRTNLVPSQIEVVDVLGQPVLALVPVSTSTMIDTQQLANGVYFIRVIAGGKVSTKKIVVRH